MSSDGDDGNSIGWRCPRRPADRVLLECARGREMVGKPRNGDSEGGRRRRGWWDDDGGTAVPVAWPAAATKEERQDGAFRRGKKRTVAPRPKP